MEEAKSKSKKFRRPLSFTTSNLSLSEALDVCLKPAVSPPHMKKIQAIVDAAKEGDEYAQYVCWVTFSNCLEAPSLTNPPEPISLYFHEILMQMHNLGKEMRYFLPILETGKIKKIQNELYKMYLSLYYFNEQLFQQKEMLASRNKAFQAINNQCLKLRIPQIHKFLHVTDESQLRYRIEYYKKNYHKWSVVFEALNLQNKNHFPPLNS